MLSGRGEGEEPCNVVISALTWVVLHGRFILEFTTVHVLSVLLLDIKFHNKKVLKKGSQLVNSKSK